LTNPRWIPLENRDHIVENTTGEAKFTAANKRDLKVITGSKSLTQLINEEVDGFLRDEEGKPTTTRKIPSNTLRTNIKNAWK
jgi:hypothetical protein